MIVVVDTNVWISALLNPAGPPASLLQAWLDRRFQVATSPALLRELADVLARPRLRDRYRIAGEDAARFIELLAEGATVVQTSGRVYGCRDADDDTVIETAVRSGASLVVTRDDDLKGDSELTERLKEQGVIVTTVRRFLDLLADGPE